MGVSVGIIGGGAVATAYHIPAFEAHPETRIAAVADLDEERREHVADEHGIPATYSDAETLLANESLDLVSICTPPNAHRGPFLHAVRNDCHVFCEKPLATSLEAAREMARAADEAGVKTQVGYLHRYYANYQRAAKMVNSGLLGRLVEANTTHHAPPPNKQWYFRPDAGGVVRDLLPHVIDFGTAVFGDRPELRNCRMRYLSQDDVEDAATVQLDFDGATMTASVGWTQSNAGFLSRTVLVGTQGWLSVEPDELTGQINGRRVTFHRGRPPLLDLRLVEIFPTVEDDAHETRIHDFVDRVRDDRPPTIPVEQGVAITEIIQACHEMADGEAEPASELAHATGEEQ